MAKGKYPWLVTKSCRGCGGYCFQCKYALAGQIKDLDDNDFTFFMEAVLLSRYHPSLGAEENMGLDGSRTCDESPALYEKVREEFLAWVTEAPECHREDTTISFVRWLSYKKYYLVPQRERMKLDVV